MGELRERVDKSCEGEDLMTPEIDNFLIGGGKEFVFTSGFAEDAGEICVEKVA